MSLNIRPILSALLRNRTGAVLVAMQIAIALAVLVNALYIVKQRVDKIGRPTGIDVDNMFVVAVAGFTQRFRLRASMQEDLAYLRGLPGVVAAIATNSVPAERRRQLRHRSVTQPERKQHATTVRRATTRWTSRA